MVTHVILPLNGYDTYVCLFHAVFATHYHNDRCVLRRECSHETLMKKLGHLDMNFSMLISA